MDKKRKARKYYSDHLRHQMKRGTLLDVGMKGYLCSCQNREKECVREAYNVLNKYYDLLRVKKAEGTEEIKGKLDDTPKDISEDLEKEIRELQSETGEKYRFKSVESGAKNLLFIKTNIDNHRELIDKLIYDLINDKQPQTRFLVRMIPIDVVCKARVDDIKVHIEPLLQRALIDRPKTFGIAFNSRNNDSLSKDDVIKVVADMVQDIDKEIKVNLLKPELSVIVEVIKSYALLTVIKNFAKHKRYHLINLCDKDVDTIKVDEEQIKDGE